MPPCDATWLVTLRSITELLALQTVTAMVDVWLTLSPFAGVPSANSVLVVPMHSVG